MISIDLERRAPGSAKYSMFYNGSCVPRKHGNHEISYIFMIFIEFHDFGSGHWEVINIACFIMVPAGFGSMGIMDFHDFH